MPMLALMFLLPPGTEDAAKYHAKTLASDNFLQYPAQDPALRRIRTLVSRGHTHDPYLEWLVSAVKTEVVGTKVRLTVSGTEKEREVIREVVLRYYPVHCRMTWRDRHVSVLQARHGLAGDLAYIQPRKTACGELTEKLATEKDKDKRRAMLVELEGREALLRDLFREVARIEAGIAEFERDIMAAATPLLLAP